MQLHNLNNRQKIGVLGILVIVLSAGAYYFLAEPTTEVSSEDTTIVQPADSIHLSRYTVSTYEQDYQVNTNNVLMDSVASTTTTLTRFDQIPDLPALKLSRQAHASTTHRPTSKTSSSPAHRKPTTQISNPTNEDDIETQLRQRLNKKTSQTTATPPPTNGDKVIAVFYGDQMIKTGDRVKMRTLQEGQLAGRFVPANTVLYGTAQFQHSRVTITISRMVINGTTVEGFKVQVYDAQDGEAGIYVQGVDAEGSVKGSAVNAASEVLGQVGGIVGRSAGQLLNSTARQEQKCKIFNNTKVIIQ